MVVPSLLRRRLLIVEDDGMVRETIVLMLEDDYHVELAASVCSALGLLREPSASAFDVMLLDCLLPDGDLAELLAEADRRDIPVVLTSGDPHQADRFGSGRRFLAKPFTRATLLAILDSTRR